MSFCSFSILYAAEAKIEKEAVYEMPCKRLFEKIQPFFLGVEINTHPAKFHLGSHGEKIPVCVVNVFSFYAPETNNRFSNKITELFVQLLKKERFSEDGGEKLSNGFTTYWQGKGVRVALHSSQQSPDCGAIEAEKMRACLEKIPNHNRRYSLSAIFFADDGFKKLAFPELNIEVEFPPGWTSDSFGSSSVCKCRGLIAFDRSENRGGLGLVIYPSTDSTEKLLGNGISGHHFQLAGIEKSIVGSYFTYQSISATEKWKDDTVVMVQRLTASKNGINYVFYFWAKPEVFTKAKDMRERMIKNFKPI